eukprot:6207225-Pleurochrysis_carterae.AAC.2
MERFSPFDAESWVGCELARAGDQSNRRRPGSTSLPLYGRLTDRQDRRTKNMKGLTRACQRASSSPSPTIPSEAESRSRRVCFRQGGPERTERRSETEPLIGFRGRSIGSAHQAGPRPCMRQARPRLRRGHAGSNGRGLVWEVGAL